MSQCGPTACGTCPLLGLCGDPTDVPPEPCVSRFEDGPEIDPNEPRPADAPTCCGGACGA